MIMMTGQIWIYVEQTRPLWVNPKASEWDRAKVEGRTNFELQPVWPDRAIYWTWDKFLKPLATINLPKSPAFLGIF